MQPYDVRVHPCGGMHPFHFFYSFLNNLSSYEHTVFCLSIHLSMDIEIILPFGSYAMNLCVHVFGVNLGLQIFWVHT